ncbi:hypothetical protein CANMA_003895 [Candida margitis]|uniref:uncharacterized protein n=1 Tax=Candida margitis TaxID=1775924 RepID=UPI002227BA78|nr:uncharacterized protein CANMA_003895 [Candida margitis]KAI5961121.1 hypothetical protein CANMA_003895 [Candida margitis]
MSKYRELSYNQVPLPTSSSSFTPLPTSRGDSIIIGKEKRQQRQHRKLVHFKSYYFQIQNLINCNVSLSLKFEQLKSPEILSTLIKPIIVEILAITERNSANATLPSTLLSTHAFTTDIKPRSKISTFTIYILLLLRYEYLIQSENNLICFDLLVTKANVCELLAIRMLREYKSWQRIQMLFVKPPLGLVSGNSNNSSNNNSNNMAAMGMMDVNTLELSVLSKSKRFLSQPIVIHILKRFYNGDLVYCDGGSYLYYQNGDFRDDEKSALLGTESSSKKQRQLKRSTFNGENNYNSRRSSYNGDNVNEGEVDDSDDDSDADNDEMIFDDSDDRFSIRRIFNRAQLVPKYQHVLINLKLINFAIVYLIMILQPAKQSRSVVMELYFWLLALSFNGEVVTKLVQIDHRFMNLVIWNQIDLLFVCIIDLCFIFKFVINAPQYFHDVFSLIGIILFPRILAIFNNYRFFNLILLSFHKMIFNLIGLVLFFFTLISGFYFSFITLSSTQTRQDVLFNMLKIFFGFTPSVWNYWDDFNTLGKIMQMSYLFLIQFIVGTILAICLSGVFTKTRENIDHEFNFFKSNNLILYFKMGQMNQRHGVVNWYCQLFKLPLVIMILIYKVMVHVLLNKRRINKNDDDVVDLKHFVFIQPSNDQDQLFGDQNSIGYADTPQEAAAIKVNKRQAMKNHQSISTLGGGHLRTASTDSFFIDQLLNRKYGVGGMAATTNAVDNNKLDRIQTQTQNQTPIPAVNRVFSRKAHNQQQQQQRRQSPPMVSQQQLQQSHQIPIKLQKSFNVPRRGSVFSQTTTNQGKSQPPHSYAPPQSYFGSPPAPSLLPVATTTSQPTHSQEILSRISNLESLLAKRMISTSIDDSKSVMMYRINEDDNHRIRGRYGRNNENDDDDLSINSESGDDSNRRSNRGSGSTVNCNDDEDDENEEEQEEEEEEDDDDLDSEELNRTIPLKFNTLSDTEIDQYDSDETF